MERLIKKEERRQAAEEANRHEALSEEELGAIWKQFDESFPSAAEAPTLAQRIS